MSIDANDVKILVSRSLQCVINSSRRCVTNHPRVSCVVLMFFLLYIFLPSVFEILLYSSPFVIVPAIFLGGGFSCKNPRQNDYKVLNVTSIWVKDEKKGSGPVALGSESISNNDVMHRSLLDELPMKILEEKNSKCAWNHSGDSQPCGEFPDSEPSKLIGDLSVSDTECQEDDDEDEPQEERNKAVQWNEDDQQNLMDLGTSELERNRRLESMIAKRRARKMLSMQPRRNRRNDFDGYVYHDQTLVPLIVPARAVEDDGQPGSAPSMMLPKRNPFDLPYDPSEEKPNLSGGSFMEELFNAHLKEISFCRHESFVRGPGFMADFGGGDEDDDPIANSLPSFFPKLRTLGAPGFSRCRRPSDMEENEHQLRGFSSQEDLRNSADKEFPFQRIPFLQVEAAESVPDQADEPSPENGAIRNSTVLQVETAESVPDQLGKTEADLVETKESVDVETKESEDIETKDGEKDGSIDMEERAGSTDEAGDEGSSSSSSEASEVVINAVKNEAFRNSVKKVLTCLIPRKRSYGSGIAQPIEPLYDSSINAVHPTKMEERSFYTSRLLHTPTFSIASDMLVEVSEVGSPSYVVEPNSPSDRESLVYDGDVDKDNNSGDEDLWGASPHPVRLEEFGSKSGVHETGEIGKSPLGLAVYSSHDDHRLPEQQERATNSTSNEASYSTSRSRLVKESDQAFVNLDQQVAEDRQYSRSSISSSSDPLPDRVRRQNLVYLDNFVPVLASDAAPCAEKEEEPGRRHPEIMIKEEASNLAEENFCLRNSGPYNSISDDESSGREGDTEDEKSDARRSHRNSILPAMQPAFVIERVPSFSRSYPNPMSQGTLVVNENDAPVSTNLQQNVYSDCFSLEKGEHSEQPSKSPTSSSNSILSATADIVSSTSEASVNNENQDYGDLQQENHSIVPGGKHVEELEKQSSPNVHIEAVQEQTSSLQKEANETHTSLREQVHAKDEDNKSIEDDHYGSNSSFSQQIAQNSAATAVEGQWEGIEHEGEVQQLSSPSQNNESTLQETPTALEKPVAEAVDASHDKSTVVNEHVGEAEVRHQGRNDEPISEIRHEMNLLENAESRSSNSTCDGRSRIQQ